MSSSEGGREIQLAKERLASAKARVESASKTFVAAKETKKQIAKAMEIATNGVNTAQLELLSSQNEVKKAEESLKAVEKRREVVNIDSDSEEEKGNSNKKRKVSSEEETSRESASVMKVANLPKNRMYRPIARRKKDERIAKANAVKMRGRSDLQSIFTVGQRVLVWCDKTNEHWKATILGRKEKNGIPGYNIHWEGTKRKEEGKQDWVPSEDITTSEWSAILAGAGEVRSRRRR